MPAIATASTTTPSPGRVTPVRYLNANPSAPETNAGTIPVSNPR